MNTKANFTNYSWNSFDRLLAAPGDAQCVSLNPGVSHWPTRIL
jgi:hypothetical protein